MWIEQVIILSIHTKVGSVGDVAQSVPALYSFLMSYILLKNIKNIIF